MAYLLVFLMAAAFIWFFWAFLMTTTAYGIGYTIVVVLFSLVAIAGISSV